VRLACGARWLLSTGACLCVAACGLWTDNPPITDSAPAKAGEPASAGSSGAVNHAGGGATGNAGGPTLDLGGNGLTLGGSTTDVDSKPPVEPHAGLPCENPQPYPEGGGFVVCEDQSLRRGEPSACPSTLPREAPTLPLFFTDCALDTDCTESPHGLCALGQCKYGCVSDAECGEHGVCFCGPEIGQCQGAFCTSDADCPADYPCTGNHPFGTDGVTFRCQTPLDECQSDYDCPGPRMHCGADGDGLPRHCWRDPVG
jgi:hypothetical protein